MIMDDNLNEVEKDIGEGKDKVLHSCGVLTCEALYSKTESMFE